MIVFSEECSNSSLMSIISIILYGKNPAFSSGRIFSTKFCSKVSFRGFWQTSFVSPSWLWCCGSLRIGYKDSLQMSSQWSWRIFFAHHHGFSIFRTILFFLILSSSSVLTTPVGEIRLPCSQSSTAHFAHRALLFRFYAVFLQVVSVLPLQVALLPSAASSNAVKISSPSFTPSVLSTCPNEFHFYGVIP